jgi:GMP synthase-like glutamine amidotransferase
VTNIGIIVCDHFPPETSAAAGGEIPDLYRRLLSGTGDSLTFREYDAANGELPTNLDECDGWILTGSRADAHGDDPWVADLLEWIRTAIATRERIVGVCFGHQAIAQALGGTVERAATWKVGPHTLTLDATIWFAEATVELNAMHRDVVTRLPPGAVVAGRGTTAEVPAFRVADHVFCVQDHPEFSAPVTRKIIEGRRERLGEACATDGLERLQTTPTQGDVVGRYLVDFLLDRRRSPDV